MSKKEVLLLILGFMLIAIVISTIIVLGTLFFSSGKEEHSDVSNYKDYLTKLKDDPTVHSGLYIFPEEIKKDNVKMFKYIKADNALEKSYLYYLVYNMDEDSYKAEEERLKNISVKFGDVNKKILSSKEGFKYGAYISIFDTKGIYEYALLNKSENTIIYVFNQLLDWKDAGVKETVIPQDYSVKDEIKDSEIDGYNMYYIYDESGNEIYFKEGV